MTLGLTISLAAGLGLACFGAGWMAAHAHASRKRYGGTKPKVWR